MYKFRIDVKDDDVNKCREVLSVIIYFAGYCCYAVLKKIKCNNCKSLIFEWDNVEEIPEIVIKILSYIQYIHVKILSYTNYVVVVKLIKNYSFLHSVTQRKSAMHITLNDVTDCEFLFNIDSCNEVHRIRNRKNVCLELNKCTLKAFFRKNYYK